MQQNNDKLKCSDLVGTVRASCPFLWIPAEKLGDQYYYPAGLLEVTGSDIGNHRIARYKSADGFWCIQHSKFGEETFAADRLHGFLAVPDDKISWHPVQNNELPTNKYFIPDKLPGEQQKCIGKHTKFGVGYVTRDLNTKQLTFYHENGTEVTGFEVLCTNRLHKPWFTIHKISADKLRHFLT